MRAHLRRPHLRRARFRRARFRRVCLRRVRLRTRPEPWADSTRGAVRGAVPRTAEQNLCPSCGGAVIHHSGRPERHGSVDSG
ncbi:pentapeptide repeat-containing protein [Streptomyces sp. NPDC006335]|uniref:pentapeptide repeat-containing protein n=1 Tax=Streptomyces sp. NPDC006335 TaxID=3156895 RepID=UPI0033A755DE